MVSIYIFYNMHLLSAQWRARGLPHQTGDVGSYLPWHSGPFWITYSSDFIHVSSGLWTVRLEKMHRKKVGSYGTLQGIIFASEMQGSHFEVC
jgi:hypothetical protein